MTDAASPDASRKLVRNLVLALGVFIVGGTVALLAGGGGSTEEARAIGPAPGTELADYEEERRRALDGADGGHTAVVSFADYLDVAAARDAVGLRPRSWLVAAPGGAPAVTDDVEAWRAETAAAARAEAEEFEGLVATAGDPEFERQYEQDRQRALRVAERLSAGDAVVFGVVVQGPADALRAAAGDRRVRLVDLVPERGVGSPRGLRPEERQVAGQPPERP